MKKILSFLCMLAALVSCKKTDSIKPDALTTAEAGTEASTLLITVYTRTSPLLMKWEDIVVTDPEGNILEVLKKQEGETLKIYSKTHYDKQTVNLYHFQFFDPNSSIRGYVGIQKGCVWHLDPPKKYKSPKRVIPFTQFKNFPALNYGSLWSWSTDMGGSSNTWLAIGNKYLLSTASTSNGKFFTQLKLNGKGYYNFFDLPSGPSDTLTIDVSKCTLPSMEKTFTMPQIALTRYASISGKPSKGYDESYLFDESYAGVHDVTLYYPNMPVEQFEGTFRYYFPFSSKQGAFEEYQTSFRGTFPDKITVLDAKAKAEPVYVNDYKLNTTGNFNYSMSAFSEKYNPNRPLGYIASTLTVYAPAGTTDLHIPDLFAYEKITGVQFKDLQLSYIALVKHNVKHVSPIDIYTSNFRNDYIMETAYFRPDWAASKNKMQVRMKEMMKERLKQGGR